MPTEIKLFMQPDTAFQVGLMWNDHSLIPPNNVLALDERENLSEVKAVPRRMDWRVRYEDFGLLAYQPGTETMFRLGDETEADEFISTHDIFQIHRPDHIDNSLRAPVKLFLDLTKICNLQCEHCLSNSGRSKETLPLEAVKSILDQSRDLGVFQVKLSGGEPILHPRFFEIVNYINEIGMSASISTNGSVITPIRAELLAKTQVKVSVSIDGEPEMHDRIRADASYEKALAGVERLLEAGIRPGLRMTIFNHPNLNNLSNVKHVVELGERFGLKVKLRRAKPSGRAVENNLALMFPTDDYWELLKWLKTATEQGANIDLEDLMCLSGDGSNKLFPTEFDCAAGTRSIHVDPHGNVSPCVFLGKDYISGNVFYNRLSDIWYNGKGFKDARNYTEQPNSDCASCGRNKLCSGECRAIVFAAREMQGLPFDGGGKDACCPREGAIYNLEMNDDGLSYSPVKTGHLNKQIIYLSQNNG